MTIIYDKTYQKFKFNYVNMAIICDKINQKIKFNYVNIAIICDKINKKIKMSYVRVAKFLTKQVEKNLSQLEKTQVIIPSKKRKWVSSLANWHFSKMASPGLSHFHTRPTHHHRHIIGGNTHKKHLPSHTKDLPSHTNVPLCTYKKYTFNY